MISSAPRLNVLVELVTKAKITLSSTPDSASRSTSATGPVSLTPGGSGFMVEIGWAGASTVSSSVVCAADRAFTTAGAGAAASGDAAAASTTGVVLRGWLKDSCWKLPATGRTAKANPRLH